MKAPHTQKQLRNLALLLVLLPPLFAVSLTAAFGVNIPFLDEWDMLYLFDRYDAGLLSVSDLWVQHNEHRLVFPKALFLLFGIFSRHNLRLLMFFSLFLAALQCLLFIRHINRNAKGAGLGRESYLLWVLCSIFLFSPVQRQNWLWGFQLQWFLNLLAVGAGGYLFSNCRPSAAAAVGLAACGVVATFSLSSGMLYWPVLLFFMAAGGRFGFPRYSFGRIGILASAFVGVCLLYMVGYEKPAAHPSLLFFTREPLAFLRYVAVYIGSPLAVGGTTAEAAAWGTVGILFFLFLAVAVCKRADRAGGRFSALFVIAGSYSLLSAVLTAVGRGGLGPAQALASRYTSVSALLWISVFSLSFYAVKTAGSAAGARRRGRGCLFVLGLFFAMFAINSAAAVGGYPEVYRSRMCGAASVLQPSRPECLGQLYPDPRRLLEKDVPLLRRLGLSVFAEAQEIQMTDNR